MKGKEAKGTKEADYKRMYPPISGGHSWGKGMKKREKRSPEARRKPDEKNDEKKLAKVSPGAHRVSPGGVAGEVKNRQKID